MKCVRVLTVACCLFAALMGAIGVVIAHEWFGLTLLAFGLGGAWAHWPERE